jgi:2-polyprenyl-3-methyl-5-hydroxy-6-metoxy-1,4-benzoquinol methylase
MDTPDTGAASAESRGAWNANAAFWDERMGDDGNDFVNVLIWPPTERLLAVRPGERVLDACCGNGVYARRLAALGAHVLAFDFADELVARARRRTAQFAGQVECRVLDATDEAALLALGEPQFDAAICQMALMDMAEITPLFRALSCLLHPGGRFVFSIMHPAFNNPYVVHVAEVEDREGDIRTVYSVKTPRYMTPGTAHGLAILGQPKAQLYFHRPLRDVLGAGFAAGFVVDALEESAFPADHPIGRNPLAWGANYSEIPPVLIVRMRPGGSLVSV